MVLVEDSLSEREWLTQLPGPCTVVALSTDKKQLPCGPDLFCRIIKKI